MGSGERRSAGRKVEGVGVADNLMVVEPIRVTVPEFTMISYRIKGPSGIRCANGDLIYLLPHSSHENPEIGDVCLGFTKNRKIFVNFGHICGGMVHYVSQKGEIPQNASAFFRDFKADTDDMPWQILSGLD